MTLYVPVVPSKIDGFECIPIRQYDNGTDVFASQTSGENKFRFFYDPSPLNQDSDYTHVAIRFLSLDSNVNPIIDKYSTGTFIAAKESNSNGNYIEIPAHLFIQPANTVIINNIRIDPTDSLPKIVTGTSPTTYRNITYDDYTLVEDSGVNQYYRSQIKLLNLTANNSFSYTSSRWQVVARATTSISINSAVITVSTSSGIIAGLNVIGPGVALGATVASVSGTTITLSAVSTQTTTSTVSFYIGQNFLNSDIGQNVSDWSYQTVMKPVFISNLIGYNSQGNEYIGVTDFKSRLTTSGALHTTTNTASSEFYSFEFKYPVNEEETIIEYEFTLFNNSKVKIDGSGPIEFQRYLNQTAVTWTNSVALIDNQTYYLSIFFKTESGFEYTKRYQLTADYTLASLTVNFLVTNDKNNGRIEFEISNAGTSSNGLILLKSSLDEGYDNFKPIAVFDTVNLTTTTSSKKYFYDYFIEPGMLYKYKFQSATINSSGDIISRGASTTTSIQPQIIPDFTGSFLYGKNDIQINFIYNGQLSGLREVKKDAFIETIGGKFPFIIRNSNLGYKQFNFTALITHVSDPTRSLGGLTYTELLSNLKRDSDNNYILSLDAKNRDINERYEDYILNGPNIFTSSTSSYATLSIYGKNNINQQNYLQRSDNFLVEKQFRKKIIDWLSNGEAKVFKSDTEGLILVKLTDITFEPVNELGRVLYSFSCTMTQIGELTYENLIKYGLKKKKYDKDDLYLLSNINDFPVSWIQNSYYPSSQYFYVTDTNEIRFYLVQTTGTTGTTTPSSIQNDVSATYTSSSGTYEYKFIGYKIPARF
jgi:hypothetical protein